MTRYTIFIIFLLMNWKKHLWWIIPLVVIVVLYAWFKGTYNTMVSASKDVDGAWGQVQIVLQRRADLLGNLAESVRSAAKFEKSTLVDITNARAGLTQATQNGTRNEQIAAAQKMDQVAYQFRIQVEAYPQLTATQSFRDMMTELEGSENRIAVERKRYNDSVLTYNKIIATFPNLVFARMFNFQPTKQYAAPTEDQTVPKLNLDVTN